MSATEFYLEGGYATSNPAWHQEDSPWKAARIVEMLNRNGLKPKTVCEVGCGAGAILASLQQQLPDDVQFIGCEPSPQACLMAEPKSNGRLSFVNRSTPAEGARFDLLLVIDVIEHIEDCFSFLRSLRSAGQQFVLHIPLDLSVLSVLREWPLIKRRKAVGHIHYFTKKTALATIEDCGLEIEDYFYTTLWRDTERSLKQTLLRKLPHKLLFALGQSDLAAKLLGEYSLMVLAKPAAAFLQNQA